MDIEINARTYAQGVRDGLLQASEIANGRVVWFSKLENTAGTDHAAGALSVAFEIRDAVTKIEVESPYKWQLSKSRSTGLRVPLPTLPAVAQRTPRELLPVSRTPGLGVLMRSEGAGGTTIV